MVVVVEEEVEKEEEGKEVMLIVGESEVEEKAELEEDGLKAEIKGEVEGEVEGGAEQEAQGKEEEGMVVVVKEGVLTRCFLLMHVYRQRESVCAHVCCYRVHAQSTDLLCLLLV